MSTDDLSGVVVAITGAAGGIGSALTRGAAERGAHVLAMDTNLEMVEVIADEIRQAGGSAMARKVDVREAAQVGSALDAAVAEFGRLDVMFNNAGISREIRFLDTTEDTLRLIFDVNVLGVLNGTQQATRIFLEQGGGGKVINTCSVASRSGRDNFAAYCASKAAVLSLVQSGARALAEHGITVNGFAPGAVETPLWKSASNLDASAVSDRLRDFLPRIPLGRVSVPADVVPLAMFLASPGADYMTGQVIMVDGGMEMV
jgi:meso-butanediol dehydrogenase/(S,S)-butanediol dehydrogenase/diacetyl reductase